MADRNIRNIQNLIRDMNAIKKNLVNKTTRRKVGADIVRQIRTRTRLGKGVQNGRIVTLKPLSDSYIEQRKGNVAFYTDNRGRKRAFVPRRSRVKLSSFTTASRSNATATGQLLKAMYSQVIGDSIIISFRSNRTRTLTGASTNLTNQDVLQAYEDGDRFFFALAKFEEEKIVKTIRQAVIKKFDKLTRT